MPRSRLVRVISVATLVLLAALAVALNASQQRSRRQLEKTFRQRSSVAAALVSSLLEQSVTQTQTLARTTLTGDHISPSDLRAAGGGFGATIVVDARNRVIAAEPPTSARLGSLATEWGPGVAGALAGGRGSIADTKAGIVVTAGFDSPAGRRVAVSVLPHGLLAFFFEAYLGRVRSNPLDDVYLLARDGSVIATASNTSAAAVRRDRVGDFVRDGRRLYAARATVAGTGGWKVGMTTRQASLYAPVRGLGGWLPWALFASLSLLSLVVVMLLRRLSRNATELQDANDELQVRNAQVVAADQMKSNFLATMSHELRTPLNSIIGFAELMHDGRVGPVSDDHREYLGDILSSANHLRRLIDDVLDLSKVEAGKMDLRPEQVECEAVVKEVCDVVRSLAERKQIDLRHRVDPSLPALELDPGKLKQVLFNYVSNAIKFTPEGGHVTVIAAPAGDDRFRITVEDDGPGIPEEDMHLLWEAFEQLDSGSSRRYGGTGLGLSLTRQIVEAQGGEVGVESVVGEGARFFVVLPLVVTSRELLSAAAPTT